MPLGPTLGINLVSVEDGRAELTLDVSDRVLNTMGYLHGGAICGLADSVVGLTHISTLEAGESGTTVELKINFLRPVFRGQVRGVGTILKSGKTLTVVECEIYDDDRKLVAKATGTCMTLRGEQAAGR